ncbi:MAG: archease [Desulfobacteraceae bacterium]|jgi:SHS2 domain-containing protein|nr:MAG: archease [Desulfobacteraceae bacterium]
MTPYTLIDHTADIGIHITGKELKDLFTTAAEAMFDQIIDRSRLLGRRKKDLLISGMDRHVLLINWLRELLEIWTIDGGLVRTALITEMDETHIHATAAWDAYDPEIHEILKDIKAVTYSGVSVEPIPEGWQATVIFDV